MATFAMSSKDLLEVKMVVIALYPTSLGADLQAPEEVL